jgi:hypothetical protein
MEKTENLSYRATIAGGGVFAWPESEAPETPEISDVERLLNEFEAHEGLEKEIVERYREISERSQDPLLKFLLELIISDEEKHYKATHAMVSTLKGSLTWTKPKDAIHGFANFVNLGEEREELLKLTEDFIRQEKEGIKGNKKLMKASKGYYRDLFTLLFKMMNRDSEKHVEILEFLRDRLKAA